MSHGGFSVPNRWMTKPPVGAQIDWRHPQARGLELCYLVNEGQGTILHDLTGRGHDVTVGLGSGDPLWTEWITDTIRGWPGPALLGKREAAPGIGGVNITTGNMALPLVLPVGSTWSIEFWLYRTDILPANATFGYLFAPGGPAGVPILAVFSGAATVQWSDGTYNRSHALLSQAWNHVVVIKRGGTASEALLDFYVNMQWLGSHPILDTAIRWNKFLRNASQDPIFTGKLGLTRAWTRALAPEEVTALYHAPYAMVAKRTTFFRNAHPPSSPSLLEWQAQAVTIPRGILALPAPLPWAAQAARLIGQIPFVIAATMAWRTQRWHRTLLLQPTRMQWRAQTQVLPVGLFLRDCGEFYETALGRTAIGGDWLISAPALDLYQSMNYEAGGFWEHRILDISDIEISAPPGGGICSGANVTITLAETGRGQSIIALWERASAVGAVTVTIDFLLAGAGYVLRIFTGSIDSIVVKDAVAQILLVDDSIHHNSLLPKELITIETFPQADTAALTRAMPLIYGHGAKIGAAPLLFIDVGNNAYLLAGHPMQLGGQLAVYDQPTQTFLTLDPVVYIPNHGTATITLGTVGAGLRVTQDSTIGMQGPNAIDGNPATVTVVHTNINGGGEPRGVPVGNGWGYVGWSPSAPGGPHAGTFQVDIWNHRRSPGSDPTTVGTFWFRTLNAEGTTHVRDILVSPKFRHVTSAQHDVFILSNVNIGVTELFQILLISECEGQVGGANQTYEVGEVSLTPLFAVSANISGLATAVVLPINLQDLRFNQTQHPLSVYAEVSVSHATHAIDGLSVATWALIYTSSLDSNLDGYGELIVTTEPTSAQRANNTVVIDLLRHGRYVASDPTLTGTFSLQTYNTVTGVLLRDNLFVTQAFRHATNPLSTSYVATAINLGINTQLAVRAVARNEGGVGGPAQYYEVGEIGIESFYQPRGDSGELFLYGPGYEGRSDLAGTIVTYLGASPGYVYHTPDEVMTSLSVEEMGLAIDLPSFATAHNWYAGVALGGAPLYFDGGIGAGWAIEQANGRDILDSMAKQATAIVFPTFEATWGIRPFRTDIEAHQHFDANNILTEEGAEAQRPEDRNSTVQLTLGNLQNVFNHFEVRYRYNTGSQKYDAVYKVTKEGSNLDAGTLDKAAIEQSCYTSWLRYGDLEPMIVEANWIADDATAAYLLRHLVFYFSQQRIIVQFETTLKAGCLQVGDFITITDASLPEGDNGATYEVHTIRYRPLKGRVQLVCSRVSTIPDVGIPPTLAAAVGCARFQGSPGMVACWDFEEVSGDRLDHLHEYALTPVNGPMQVPGKVGNAVSFRQAQAQYLTGSHALSGFFTGSFTLACWVRLRSVPTDWVAFVGNEDPTLGYPSREIFFGVGTGGFVHLALGYANGIGVITTPWILPFTNTEADWTLLRAWRYTDGPFAGNMGVWMNNGANYTDVQGTLGTVWAQGGFLVGASYTLGGGLYGLGDFDLDQLMIWRRVLGGDDWDAIWNNGLG